MCDVRRGELVGPKCDVWALGVSLFKMTRLRDLFGVAGEERLAILNFEPHAKLPRPSADAAAVCRLGARSLDTLADQASQTPLCLGPICTSRVFARHAGEQNRAVTAIRSRRC